MTEPGFRDHCELNALQNARVADRQGQFANEGRGTCRVASDSYRGVSCLTGVGEVGEDHEHSLNDD